MPGRPARGGRQGRGGRGFSRETNLRRRPAGTREERRTVLIVTNGEDTEADYFKALHDEPWVKDQKVKMKITYKNGSPMAAVIRAATIRDDDEYDEAWAVCDVDEYDVKPAMQYARKHAVELTLSMPSFEVWLILHLKDGCPGFNNGTQAGAHLKKLISTWDKTKLDFNDFRDGVHEAVDRAKRRGEPPDANPSTSVWRLIESLSRLRANLAPRREKVYELRRD